MVSKLVFSTINTDVYRATQQGLKYVVARRRVQWVVRVTVLENQELRATMLTDDGDLALAIAQQYAWIAHDTSYSDNHGPSSRKATAARRALEYGDDVEAANRDGDAGCVDVEEVYRSSSEVVGRDLRSFARRFFPLRRNRIRSDS